MRTITSTTGPVAEQLQSWGPCATGEAGLTKAEIRELSGRGLPGIIPRRRCLATRFPTGTMLLTAEALAEWSVQSRRCIDLLGAGGLRVRDHYPVARIELPAERIADVAQEPLRGKVVSMLKDAGYRFVTLDLSGYRMGSMNDQPGER